MSRRVVVPAFLLCLLQLSQATVPSDSVRLISATSATDLRDVFFSGAPWLVQCATASATASVASGETSAVAALHEAVRLSLSTLPKEANVGILDCRAKLPSGKRNTIDRFGLDSNASPVLFAVANARNPLQVTAEVLRSYTAGGGTAPLFPTPSQHAAALAAMFAAKTKPKASALTTTAQLHSSCLRRPKCALVLLRKGAEAKGDAGRVLAKLMLEHRNVSFVTINSANYQISLEGKMPEPTASKPALLAVRSSGSGKGSKHVALAARAHRGSWEIDELTKFLGSFVRDELELTPLTKSPSIRWRKQGQNGAKSGAKSGTKSGAKGGSGGQDRDARKGGRTKGGGGAGGNGKSGGGRGSGGDASASQSPSAREAERRRQMAEEEEAYLRDMFEEEGGGGDQALDEDGFDGDESDGEEEVLDFDEDVDGGGEAEEDAAWEGTSDTLSDKDEV